MNSEENLKQQLAAWNVDIEVPPRFQANVWAQIATRESSRRSLWDQLGEWIATEFRKPRLATSAVALGLVLSSGIAYLQAQDSNVMVEKQLEVRYMETINPLAHTSHAQ